MCRAKKNLLVSVATAISGGFCMQLGCAGSLVNIFEGFNPCGSILLCDPREYQFVTSGIDGPGVRPDEDPFCTFPPFCTAAQDPIFGGLAP